MLCKHKSRVRISVSPHIVVAQLVEQWSPKPPVVGSSPSNYAINLCIVQHMSKYFAQEIFEAVYSDVVDYTWL